MATLSLFPARVPFVDSDGRLTPEAYRALNALFDRVGGTFGDLGEDTFAGVFAQFQAEEEQGADMVVQPAHENEAQEQSVMQPSSEVFIADMVLQPPSWGGAIEDITVGASPFDFTAHSDGILSISGGTVTPFTAITRGATTITTGVVDGLVPVNAGDIVTVTYTVAPTLKFIPR